MDNNVFLTAEGIIEIEVVGDQSAESIRSMGAAVKALLHQLRADGRPVLIIDNIRRLGETDSAARREVARLARELPFDRCVMLGNANPLLRYGSNLMLQAIGRPNIRYFANRDAALIWLGIPVPVA